MKNENVIIQKELAEVFKAERPYLLRYACYRLGNEDDAKDVLQEKKMAGRTYMGTVRTTFVIDEQGVIAEVYSAKQIKVKEHAQQILK